MMFLRYIVAVSAMAVLLLPVSWYRPSFCLITFLALAGLAAARPKVRGDGVLVPVVPTVAMLEAWEEIAGFDGSPQAFAAAYTAMLAARPKPSAGGSNG